MNFTNKLNDTLTSLDKLDNLITNDNNKDQLKKHLLSLSDDLAKYKDIHEKNTTFDGDDIKSNIQDVLKKINEIEISVRNKLILTEKYNSYLNS
tara:strand:- start:133 stop:414 length:282 start_codon:yes stop_codon:yes gene_type:complete